MFHKGKSQNCLPSVDGVLLAAPQDYLPLPTRLRAQVSSPLSSANQPGLACNISQLNSSFRIPVGIDNNTASNLINQSNIPLLARIPQKTLIRSRLLYPEAVKTPPVRDNPCSSARPIQNQEDSYSRRLIQNSPIQPSMATPINHKPQFGNPFVITNERQSMTAQRQSQSFQNSALPYKTASQTSKNIIRQYSYEDRAFVQPPIKKRFQKLVSQSSQQNLAMPLQILKSQYQERNSTMEIEVDERQQIQMRQLKCSIQNQRLNSQFSALEQNQSHQKQSTSAIHVEPMINTGMIGYQNMHESILQLRHPWSNLFSHFSPNNIQQPILFQNNNYDPLSSSHLINPPQTIEQYHTPQSQQVSNEVQSPDGNRVCFKDNSFKPQVKNQAIQINEPSNELPQSANNKLLASLLKDQHKLQLHTLSGGVTIFKTELGRGPTGSVRLGYNPKLGGWLAVKDFTEEGKVSWVRESSISLKSAHIVSIRHSWSAGSVYYLAMELCEITLKEASKSLNIVQAIIWSWHILRGLNELHKAGIIHRDIKLENVLIKNGIAKLADFGLAVKVNALGYYSEGRCGTPYTMAPQVLFATQKDMVDYTYSGDIWALGVLMYTLFHKTHPFAFDAQRVRRNSRVALNCKWKQINSIIDRTLSYESKSRPNIATLTSLFESAAHNYLWQNHRVSSFQEALKLIQQPNWKQPAECPLQINPNNIVGFDECLHRPTVHYKSFEKWGRNLEGKLDFPSPRSSAQITNSKRRYDRPVQLSPSNQTPVNGLRRQNSHRRQWLSQSFDVPNNRSYNQPKEGNLFRQLNIQERQYLTSKQPNYSPIVTDLFKRNQSDSDFQSVFQEVPARLLNKGSVQQTSKGIESQQFQQQPNQQAFLINQSSKKIKKSLLLESVALLLVIWMAFILWKPYQG